MASLFVGNFSFELWRTPGFSLPRRLQRFESELACLWLALASEGDEILCDEPVEPSFLSHMESLGCAPVRWIAPQEITSTQADRIVPWGWTPAIRRLAEQAGLPVIAPNQTVVWQANSREFSAELEAELPCGLAGGTLARSLEQVETFLAQASSLDGKWLVKPNFSQAGRGQISATHPLDDSQRHAIERLLQRDAVVAVEPILDNQCELGCQWEISPEGSIQFLTMTRLLTDRRGGYLGTSLEPIVDEKERAVIVETQRQAVERLRDLGYFGPVGIDAMIYQVQSQRHVRPLQDVNARWTMGRIAWEWGKTLEGSEATGEWRHAPDAPVANAIPLSPEMLGGAPVSHRTWWVPR